jgi:hypothetical protein
MSDTYNLLNKDIQPPHATFNYTLTDANYAEISSQALKNATNASDSALAKTIKSTNSLPEGYAATYVPALLKAMYPALGKGSNAHVTYNFNDGPLPYLEELTSAGQYTLSADDYKSMGGAVRVYGYFSPSNAPNDFIPNFLKSKYAGVADSTLKLVTYKYATTDPSGGEITVFDEEFSDSTFLNSFQAFNITGDQVWTAASYKQDHYTKMSGYSAGNQNNEDWLVSPAINLKGFTSPSFQIDQVVNYLNNQWDQTTILVSTDYTGNVSTATWTQLNINTLPTGNNWTYVTSEKVDLSAYAGKTIHIALKYISTTSNASTWEVNWLKVYGTIGGSGSSIPPEVIKESSLYRLLNSTWGIEPGVYVLSSQDYSSMGAPGKYDSFSSSEPPDNYLPQFLAQKYPYAQEGKQLVVMYKYYSKGTQIRADQYTFTNSTWTKYNPVEMKTSQFINTGTKWVFDPTVTFTMTAADYQSIVDAVKADPNLKSLVNSYGDQDYYYGAGSKYSDFDARISKRTTGTYAQADYQGLTDAEASALILKRIHEGIIVLLKIKFPNAVTQVSGINVMYVVTYAIYENDGSTEHFTSTFQCTKSTPNPDFTFVSTTTAK